MKRLWAPWRMEYIENSIDKDEDCIFCEKPKQNTDQQNLIVHRSDLCFIILNKFPYNNGHLMVVPYVHESSFVNLSREVLADVDATLKRAVQAVTNTMHPQGMNIGINLGRSAGAGIDTHIHYHLVPRWNGDTNFMPVLTNTKVVSEALEKTWLKLSNEFKNLIESGA